MKTVTERIFNTNNTLGEIALRIPLGIIFIAHGSQKLFGWFGGFGLDGTGQYMASLGLNPGYFMALMAGSAELFGGIALLIGLLVRPAGAVLAITMVVAIFSAHFENGLFLSNNGYEFALALFAATLSLALTGAGKYSVDEYISQKFIAASIVR